jgi:hypothetical protein
MDAVEQEIMHFVKRFPFNSLDFYRRLLVRQQHKMTDSELAEGLRRLSHRGLVYEPRPGVFDSTAFKDPEIVKQTRQGKMRAVHPAKKPKKKPKILKSKVKIVKRRRVEGYECRACGKWVRRSWSKRRLRKCPRCGKKMYYGKPVLKKQYRTTEKHTKFWKSIFVPIEGRFGKPIRKERVGKQGIVAARWKEPPPKPTVIAAPLHMKRSEFKGSAKARNAAYKAWETRRKQGWMGKGEIARLFRIVERRRDERRIIAFRKDKRTGKTRPITARVFQGKGLKKKIIPRRNGLEVRPGS